VSTTSDITLTFDVHGTTSNVNGDYADYQRLADLARIAS